MSAFGLYFVVLTVLLLLYYACLIAWDLFKKDSKQRDDVEEIDVSDTDDEEPTSVHVTEKGIVYGEAEPSADGEGGDEQEGDPDDDPYADEESDIADADEDETFLNDDSGKNLTDEQLARLQAQLAAEMDAVEQEYQYVYDSTEFHVTMRQPRSSKTKVLRSFGNDE